LAAKYGLRIGALSALIFSAASVYLISSSELKEIELTDAKSILFAVSFLVTITSMLIGVMGTIGKKLVLMNNNA